MGIGTGIIEVQMVFGTDVHFLKVKSDDGMVGKTETPRTVLVVSVIMLFVASVGNGAENRIVKNVSAAT